MTSFDEPSNTLVLGTDFVFENFFSQENLKKESVFLKLMVLESFKYLVVEQ